MSKDQPRNTTMPSSLPAGTCLGSRPPPNGMQIPMAFPMKRGWIKLNFRSGWRGLDSGIHDEYQPLLTGRVGPMHCRDWWHDPLR
eukprot:8496960-Pyramimonas_sp.AAC.1